MSISFNFAAAIKLKILKAVKIFRPSGSVVRGWGGAGRRRDHGQPGLQGARGTIALRQLVQVNVLMIDRIPSLRSLPRQCNIGKAKDQQGNVPICVGVWEIAGNCQYLLSCLWSCQLYFAKSFIIFGISMLKVPTSPVTHDLLRHHNKRQLKQVCLSAELIMLGLVVRDP